MKRKSNVLMWLAFVIYLILFIKIVVLRLPLSALKDAIMNLSLSDIWNNFVNGQLIPFKTIYHHYRYTSMHQMVVTFGWLTLWAMPFGYFLPSLTKTRQYTKVLIFGLLLGLLLEVLQLILLSYHFNIDDVLQVGIGISIGYGAYKLSRY